MIRGMALDFAPSGVRVNAIYPGAIHSGLMEAYVEHEPDQKATIVSMIPLGFIGEPDHIAGVAYFLAFDDAAYITGAAIVSDGGLLARLAISASGSKRLTR